MKSLLVIDSFLLSEPFSNESYFISFTMPNEFFFVLYHKYDSLEFWLVKQI